MGSMSPYGVGGTHRHTPEIEQNLAASAGAPVTRLLHARRWRRWRAASWPPAPRGSPPGADAAAVRAAWDAGVRRRALRPPAARGPVAADRRRARAATSSTCRSPSTSAPAGVVAVAAIDNLTKGTAGGAVQCAQPRPRPARDDRPADRRGSRRERHRRRPASAPPASPPGSSPAAAPTSRSSSTTGPTTRRRRLHRRNRVEAAPVTWSRQVLADGGSTPWSSTPAAPTPAPAPQGFPDTHATAEHVARLLDDLGRRRRRLLHRADRRAAADGPAARRRHRGRRRPVRRRWRRRGRRDHDHRHRRQAGPSCTRDGWTRRRDGQGRRHARTGAGDHARGPHDRRRRRRGRRCDAALRVRHGDDVRPDRLRRLHVDQRHGAAAGLRRLRGHARPRRARRRRHPRSARDLARQLIADAEGAAHDIAIEVRARRRE